MNTACRVLLAVVAVMSVMEVLTQKEHHTEDEHDFQEFDDEPAAKYSPEANADAEEESIEIRDPSAMPKRDKAFAVPANLPPLRFSFW